MSMSSPDQSSCSSDTGDVLIRSTRVLLSDRRHEAGPGPGFVQITVQKLRDPPVQPFLAEQQRSSGTEKQQQRPEPREKPDNAPPQRAAGRPQPDRLKKPGSTKENREPRRRQQSSPDRKLSASSEEPGHDLLTSRFATGGRGVVLAALRQRSHSAPPRRGVRVQLLDPTPLQSGSQHAVGVVGGQTEAGLGAAAVIRVLSAQRVRSASKLQDSLTLCRLQAQKHLEARVSQLDAGVQKLLQADSGRVLSQQTLQHLERLHSQQLQQQSQLLESALKMVTGHVPVTSDPPASGQPTRLQVTHLDSAENVLSNRQRSSSATRAAAASLEMVAMATPWRDRWPEQTRNIKTETKTQRGGNSSPEWGRGNLPSNTHTRAHTHCAVQVRWFERFRKSIL